MTWSDSWRDFGAKLGQVLLHLSGDSSAAVLRRWTVLRAAELPDGIANELLSGARRRVLIVMQMESEGLFFMLKDKPRSPVLTADVLPSVFN